MSEAEIPERIKTVDIPEHSHEAETRHLIEEGLEQSPINAALAELERVKEELYETRNLLRAINSHNENNTPERQAARLWYAARRLFGEGAVRVSEQLRDILLPEDVSVVAKNNERKHHEQYKRVWSVLRSIDPNLAKKVQEKVFANEVMDWADGVR
jgi:hypothetical protein